jgi:hypothetical protein
LEIAHHYSRSDDAMPLGRGIPIRELITAVAIVALVVSAWMARRVWWYLATIAGWSIHAWGPFLLLAFLSISRLRGRIPRRILRILFVVTLSVSIYLLGTFYRIATEAWFDGPLGFPYPDHALFALNAWFDARHPVPRDVIKVHREWPRVAYVIGIATIMSLIAAGFFVTLLIRPHPSKKEA